MSSTVIFWIVATPLIALGGALIVSILFGDDDRFHL